MLFLGLCIVATLAAFVQPVLSYIVDRKHLRKLPSPSFAGVSSIWRMWHNYFNRHYLVVDAAHRKLGTHVRIAPRCVSILSTQAATDIYGHGANMLKSDWYDGGAGDYRHMADVRIKADHQAKRKMLAHVFAQKTIANLEPVMADTVAVLVAQIDKYADAGCKMNMRKYMNFFTIDLFAQLLYSESLGCLERGDDIVDAETPDGKIYKAPYIQSLLDATVLNTILGMEASILPISRKLLSWHPYKRAGADFENIVYHNTSKRLRDPAAEEDIFSKLLKDSKGNDTGIKPGDLLAECSVMMNAGTETTTAAFTNTLYLIYKHPAVLTKLREELDAACGFEEVASYSVVSDLPYLRACVEESLRVRPPSSFGLPREVPKGGRMIAGQWIDEGVTVSVPAYSLLRDETVFDRAGEFIPERWLTEDKEKKDRMMKNHLPFSTGPRACIGRNIAYFEQLLVISTLVRAFDFSMANEFELQTIERFNSNPGDFFVGCQRRIR